MTKTKTMTLADLRSWHPCWRYEGLDYDARVARLAGRRKHWRLEHIVALRGRDGLRDADWLWLVIRAMAHLGMHRELRLFAVACARRALQRVRRDGGVVDKRSWRALRVAKDYAIGKATPEQLRAAWAAAEAAWDAAWDAARDAARAAARTAARTAAWAAAEAAGTAELSWQCDRLADYALGRVA